VKASSGGGVLGCSTMIASSDIAAGALPLIVTTALLEGFGRRLRGNRIRSTGHSSLQSEKTRQYLPANL
jgi:ABC-type lipoprotein release transport system permease subunit